MHDVAELADGEVAQVLDIAQLVRRARTINPTSGIFRIILRNVHAGAGDEFSTYDPYNPDSVLVDAAIPPYPTTQPRLRDIWVLTAAAQRVSGSGNCSGVLTLGNIQQGYGIDSAGVAVVNNQGFPIVDFNAEKTVGGFTFLSSLGQCFYRVGLRLPGRGVGGVQAETVRLQFLTTAAALSTWECQLIVGLFPPGLGQDVLS